MKKMLLLPILLIGIQFAQPLAASAENSSRMIDFYGAWKSISNKIQLCSDYVTSSKYFMPTAMTVSIGTYAFGNVLFCAFLANDYKQFKLLSKEEKKAAAFGIVNFIIKTLFLGRQSYSDTWDDDVDFSPMSALMNGYRDVCRGETSILKDEKHIQGFKFMGRMLLGVPISFAMAMCIKQVFFDNSRKK